MIPQYVHCNACIVDMVLHKKNLCLDVTLAFKCVKITNLDINEGFWSSQYMYMVFLCVERSKIILIETANLQSVCDGLHSLFTDIKQFLHCSENSNKTSFFILKSF